MDYNVSMPMVVNKYGNKLFLYIFLSGMTYPGSMRER